MAPKKKAVKKVASSRRGVRTPGSMSDQIDRLEVGQSVSVADRFDIEGVDAGGLLESSRRMRSTQAAYVARIKDEIDMREFKIESGQFITDDRTGIVVTVAVTRTE